MERKLEADYKLLRQVRDIDITFSNDSSFENKFKEDQKKHDEEVSSINTKIAEVEERKSELDGIIKEGYAKIEGYKKERAELSPRGQEDEKMMSLDLSIQLEEKAVKKYKEELSSKDEEIKMLHEKEADIEKAFEEYKKMINENNPSSTEDMQKLRNKRLELISQLGPEASSAFQKVSGSVTFPVASLHDGICTNCNLENIVSMQVAIKSMEEIVTCEYCGAILVDVTSSEKDEESTEKVNN